MVFPINTKLFFNYGNMAKFIALVFSVLFLVLYSSVNALENINNFSLSKIDIISAKKLDLTFNSDLESSQTTVRNFKLVNKNDDLDIIKVTKNSLI
jgi:hypothetical protein